MAKAKMARCSVRLDSKNTAVQAKVVRMKAMYDKVVKTLDTLMDKREEEQCMTIMDAVRNSNHTYVEILCFIRG